MKFNISYPLTGAQKCIEIDDDKKYSIFFDKKMGSEVEADALGEAFNGYILKITGGNDKDGFPMKQGVTARGRVRLLMEKGHKCYRPRRNGERKRKSVRGCIVGPDIAVLSLVVVKKGTADIEGLTNNQIPRRLGPKRATRIKRLFGLKKEDGVALLRKNVIRRKWTTSNQKSRQKAPKIQRLITDDRLRRKRVYKKIKKDRYEAGKKAREDYLKLLGELRKKHEHKKNEGEAEKHEGAKTDAKGKKAAPAEKKVVDKKPVEKKPVDKKPAEKKTDKPTTTQKPTKPAPEKKAAPAEKQQASKPKDDKKKEGKK